MQFEKNRIRKKYILIRKNNYFKIKKFPFYQIFNLINKLYKKKKIIIGCYYPYNYEVNILEFLNQARKKHYITALPIIKKKNNMIFKKWEFNEPLCVNKYGILEPKNFNNEVIPELILVPLVAFSNKFDRLGYGKGFYDKYLNKISQKKNIVSLGVAYSFQKCPNLPKNKLDYKLDYIFSEKGITNRTI